MDNKKKMNPILKKSLIFGGIGLATAYTIFVFVISIMLMVQGQGAQGLSGEAKEAFVQEYCTPFIGYLLLNTGVFLGAFVIPVILFLIAGIVGLVLYVRAAGKTKATLADLSAEQKDALREELLKDMSDSNKK